MRAYHNSRKKEYRNPFGAITIDGTVSLSIDLFEEEGAEIVLRTWIDGIGENFYKMNPVRMDDRIRYTYDLVCSEAALYWYSFRIDRADGTCMYYCSKQGATGGEGELTFGMSSSFQITSYKERKIPDWYKNAIVYQIFPDRYYRGNDFDEAKGVVLHPKENGPGSVCHEDWYETPAYQKDEKGRIKNWDFFGGTLNGVRDKLDHIASMGVTAIYLNPIFEASSNHRYDTADFTKIDSMLGTEEDFVNLCKEAEARGISIILDGVFNHTGCDSKYFNRYGNYPDKGAYQGEDSPYYNWFNFKEDGTYDCWWGVDDLPAVNENSQTYRDFIYNGENSVVRKWLRLGAKGWRLDVADELPDDFIAGIKEAVIKEKGEDGLLMGEVWEDASNKISYSQLRKYFLGDELDCVMNYPFRDGIESFIMGDITAFDLAEKLMSLYENYPHDNFYGNLNLLGSHDRMRTLTLFGNAPKEWTLSEEEKKNYRLNEGQKSLALGRLWIAALAQMTMPGVPCIYYGDEAGLDGYSDPYNRGTYPWGKEDKNAENIYRNAVSLRKLYSVFTDGDFEPVAFNEDVFGFYRRSEKDSALVVINRSLQKEHEIWFKAEGKATDVVHHGVLTPNQDGYIGIKIRSLGSSLIHFQKETLAESMEKGSGVLAHITSIPGGTLGEPAKKFIDFLKESGQKYWQILPLNPTDSYGSPYAGQSAFAGNITLTGLSKSQLDEMFENISDYDKKCFDDFKNANKFWIYSYAMFSVIKDKYNGSAQQTWPEKYHRYSELLYKDEKLAAEAERCMFYQFIFDRMWKEVRKYAKAQGIKIIGDMPMYVSADSSDVWSQPEMFKIKGDGYPEFEAGVPPDYFSKEGQLWGNPIYKWDVMKADGFTWWKERFSRCMDLYDYTRLDHFRGFEAFWEVPAGQKALEGYWNLGPGMDLFIECAKSLGKLPFMAEDLGTITPGVNALIEQCGFRGADVMQFADMDPLENYIPPIGKIAYSGTHDNATLKGFAIDRYLDTEEDTEVKNHEKSEVESAEIDREAEEITEKLKNHLYGSRADIVIMPLQDVLGLGDEARMNVPGVASGNWSWKTNGEGFDEAGKKLKALTEKYNR